MFEKRQQRLNRKLERFKIDQQHKADKKSFKKKLCEAWAYTMTKKVVWICLLAGVLDLIYDWILSIIASPNILNIDATIVCSHTEFTGKLWIGIIGVILAYFIRGYIDTKSEKSMELQAQGLEVDSIKDKAEEFINEVKDKIVN